jgi:hypothetical protein
LAEAATILDDLIAEINGGCTAARQLQAAC